MSKSDLTKEAIVQSLKDLSQKKELDKISIVDITNHCGLNRQTFYYHFEDKYELLSWIYLNEAFPLLADNITIDNWGDKLNAFFLHIESERNFYINTVKYQLDVFHDYFFALARNLFMDVIEKIDIEKKVKTDDRLFYSEFFAYGYSGIVIDWIKTGMQISSEELTKKIKKMVRDGERAGYILYKNKK